jgi:hypothetical protein
MTDQPSSGRRGAQLSTPARSELTVHGICFAGRQPPFSRVSELGKFLVLAGALIVFAGLLLWVGLVPRWLGRLPGDIRMERGHSAFYFPIVTCIIISLVLSLIFSFFRR